MSRPQRFLTVAVIVLAFVGCNRADSRQDVKDDVNKASTEVRAAANHAADRIADGWITTKIQAQFFSDDDIHARYIDVDTRDGRVSLRGYVENKDVLDQVASIASQTDGVRAVDNQIKIGQAPADIVDRARAAGDAAIGTAGRVEDAAERAAAAAAPAIDDARITTTIQARYFIDDRVKGRRIAVDTSGGVVTLRGEVASEDERAQALRLARSTDGVTRVEDSLTVNASVN